MALHPLGGSGVEPWLLSTFSSGVEPLKSAEISQVGYKRGLGSYHTALWLISQLHRRDWVLLLHLSYDSLNALS